MADVERARRMGQRAGWLAAVGRMRLILAAELSDAEAHLRSNREDGFDEEDPLVFLWVRHIKSLRKIAHGMDIVLPGDDIGGEE